MGKTIHLYNANRSLPRSWTKVMHAGVLGRSSWGASSTPWKEPSNSLLTVRIASMSYCRRPSHHYEGMAEDSRGTSEHGAWNTRWAGVTLSTPACVLQRANNHHICIHKEARHQLLDLQLLAHDLANRPTQIAKVLPQRPTYGGCCDAAKQGMSGVWLPSTQHPLHPPYIWWAPFPSSVQQALVSTDNPSGSITNLNLELAGTIAHEATLTMVHDLRHCTIATFSDNTPAVAWVNKASTTTAGPASYLLRSSSLLQCQHWYLLQQFYIPGPANHLADVVLRHFDLSNDALLAFLDSVAPHTQPWQMLHLLLIWLSWLTTDLQWRRHVSPSLASVPPPKIISGPNTGSLSLTSSAWTPFLRPWKTRYPSSASWRIEFGTAEPAAVVNWSGLSAYVTRSWPSQRVSPTWDSRIHA